MILRRVIHHVRNQEWTAIVLDFFIVVIGVFFGIQVSNWNADRIEANRGAFFAERLKADLRVEAWNYDVIADYLGDVQASIDTVLDSLEGTTEISDEQFLINAYRATQYPGGVRQRATYDELTSTGSIGLIKDQILRDTAIQVYTAPVIEQAANEGIDSPYRIAFRMSLPVAMQVELAAKCGDRFTAIGDFEIIGTQLNYDCETDLTPAQMEVAARALRTYPDIIRLLRLRSMNVHTQVINLNLTNQDILRQLRAITEDTQ